MSKKILTLVFILTGLVVAIIFTCYPMIISHFNIMPGDIGDERFVIYILNHWYNVFIGKESFFVLNFFYPNKSVLGYSDAFFIFGVIYSFFRALGYNYFTSLQILYVFLITFGYLTFFLFFRKILKVNLLFSIIGSLLLVNLNAIQNQFGHAQLMGFYFYPLLVYLVCSYINAKKVGHKQLSWIYLISFSVFLGLVFFSSYYVAWFFVFSLIIFILSYMTLQFIDHSINETVLYFYNFAKSNFLQLIVGFFVFIVSLIPFFITYLPVVLSGRSFPFSATLYYSPGGKDLINVGGSNYLWSPLLEFFHFNFGNTIEITSGFTLIFLLIFLILIVAYFKFRLKKTSNKEKIIFSIALTSLIIILLIVKFNDRFSLWYFVYHMVPGAKAIRALGRYLIVSQMLAAVFIVYNLNYVYKKLTLRNKRNLINYTLSILIIFISVALFLEQGNKGYFYLKKNSQIVFLSKFNSKKQCKYFFIQQKQNLAAEPQWRYQVDALMVSMKLDIPTINGYSGLSPSKWHLGNVSSLVYTYYVYEWIKINHLKNNACALNLTTGKFKKANISELKQKSFMYFTTKINLVNAAIHKYLDENYSLKNLYPTALEKLNLLDKSFGGYPKNAPNDNWTRNGYWIGKWGDSYAIGYSPITTNVAKYLYDIYSKTAKTIYFPYPKIFNIRTAKPTEYGQVLIVFNKPFIIRIKGAN